MKRALMVASVASMIDQFNMDNIRIMEDLGYQVDVACNFEFGNTSSLQRVDQFKKELSARKINYIQLSFSRNICDMFHNVNVYNQCKKLISVEKYDLIHCHSPIGGVLARLAARKSRKSGTKVIYTAHGFHFFKGALLINWLIYYPIEKICSYFTDVLITINKEDYALAQKKMHAKKVCYMPGVGIDTQKFADVVVNRDEKRAELGVSQDSFIMLSVGELSKRKNHEVIIRAIARLQKSNIHYFIAGKGDLEEYLRKLVLSLGLSNQVHLLGFRSDIGELCKVADMFCFPSLQEGLPVALMEMMATGLPVVCSKIRGNVDLIKDGQGGLLVKSTDVDGFSVAIKTLLEDPELRGEMGEYNVEAVKGFDVKIVSERMKEIYEDINL